jgi:hypothetical protein
MIMLSQFVKLMCHIFDKFRNLQFQNYTIGSRPSHLSINKDKVDYHRKLIVWNCTHITLVRETSGSISYGFVGENRVVTINFCTNYFSSIVLEAKVIETFSNHFLEPTSTKISV